MKQILVVVVLLISAAGFPQVGERVFIDGSVSVPMGDDPEGILIVNLTTNRITVSDASGSFRIAVAQGDEISFSALQFQDFSVVIDEKVMEAGKLNVFINAMTTELPEIVVRPFDLSGNVEVDVQRIEVVEPNLPEIRPMEVYDPDLTFRPDSLDSPENAAMRDRFMEYGLNFANIFRALFASREAGDEDFEPLQEDVRELYDDDFFGEYLDIERAQINNFILYAEEQGLSEDMLEQGNELELIEFLISQSERFKAQDSSK